MKGMVGKNVKLLSGVESRQEALKTLWETDFAKEISTDTWISIWEKRMLKSMTVRIKDSFYKLIWRWYLTPVKLNIMVSKYYTAFWRCGQDIDYLFPYVVGPWSSIEILETDT